MFMYVGNKTIAEGKMGLPQHSFKKYTYIYYNVIIICN